MCEWILRWCLTWFLQTADFLSRYRSNQLTRIIMSFTDMMDTSIHVEPKLKNVKCKFLCCIGSEDRNEHDNYDSARKHKSVDDVCVGKSLTQKYELKNKQAVCEHHIRFTLETPFSGENIVEDNDLTLIFFVEGMIGAGKSTMIDNFYSIARVRFPRWHLTVVREDVELFQKFDFMGKHYNPLQLAYEDPKTNLVAVQSYFIQVINQTLLDKVSEAKKKSKHNLVICDRSVYAPHIFIRQAEENGDLSEFSADYLRKLTDETAEKTFEKISTGADDNLQCGYHGAYFVNTSVDSCIERIRFRNRECESRNIDRDFMVRLEENIEIHKHSWLPLDGNKRQTKPFIMRNGTDKIDDFMRFVHLIIRENTC